MEILEKVLSREQLRWLLARERAACDRYERQLSVLLYPNATRELVTALAGRVRQTDEIGWFDQRSLCVVLPCTSSEGARRLAEHVARNWGDPPEFTLYTYPGKWPQMPEEQAKRSLHSTNPPAHQLDTLLANPTPAWKRAIDIAGAGTGLILLSPLLVLVAAAIKAASPGPALLRQKRVGRHGQSFRIWKFRTMHVNTKADVHQDHLHSLINSDQPMTKLDLSRDPRIFPVGRIIRRCYLDELPQLINVLRGEMSLVGPRPCLPYEARKFAPWHAGRFQSVPGMTGLWQVSGKNKTTFTEMIRFDINYQRRLSFRLDMTILLKTIPAIVSEIMDCLARATVKSMPHRKQT